MSQPNLEPVRAREQYKLRCRAFDRALYRYAFFSGGEYPDLTEEAAADLLAHSPDGLTWHDMWRVFRKATIAAEKYRRQRQRIREGLRRGAA